jgi:hypothetical protein
MAVLRMGLPGLKNALRVVFSVMKRKGIMRFPFAFISNSVLIPRVSASVDRIRDILFGGDLPIKGKKIITDDDLMEFELIELKPYLIVEVYRSTGDSYATRSFLSYPKFDRTLGYFHEESLTASCKEYDSVIEVLPLDISNEKDERLVDIKYTIFRVVSVMIPAANLLYSLYNLDKGVRFHILDLSYTPKDEEKVISIAKLVKESGDDFQEAIANLIFMGHLM